MESGYTSTEPRDPELKRQSKRKRRLTRLAVMPRNQALTTQRRNRCFSEDNMYNSVNEYGYEILPASTYTSKTNKNGYFLVPIPQLLKLEYKYSKYTSCKAEIEHSSTEKCKIPFNGDKWQSSSTYLSSYRILHDRQVKLYSISPFVFTQEQDQQQHTTTPTGY
ncbi:hypothetical protein ACFE04_017534 [Oxalis oulophora]